MSEPTTRFLLELARALRQAKHKGPAEGMSAGMLWAMYPEWFEKTWRPSQEELRGLKARQAVRIKDYEARTGETL
jgi:hypothetical protein